MTQAVPPKPYKSVLKWFLIALSSVLGLYFLLCVYLLVWQNRMIFKPTKIIENFPQSYALAHEEIWLPVTSQESLHGWWLPAQSPTDKVLLFLHGNSYNVGENLAHAKRFVEMGFSVLLMDYRGYRQSDGSFPSEDKVYQDAQKMYDYLIQEREVSPDDLLVYGHSLGGAIAIDLVSKNPAAGLIAEGTFTSMFDMATYGGQYSFMPVNLLLHQRFESLSKVPEITIPSLFIHGTDDDLIPVEMGETLHDTAIAPKKLFLVPEAGHNNIAKTAGESYQKMILDFLQFAQSQDALVP